MKKLLDPGTFRQIKKAGYAEMSAFLGKIYRQGYQDGQDDGITEREVREVLLSVKGIGEARADQVMEALKERIEAEKNIEYVCGHCEADLTRYKDTPYCPFCGWALTR